jgi:hypothetical protein
MKTKRKRSFKSIKKNKTKFKKRINYNGSKKRNIKKNKKISKKQYFRDKGGQDENVCSICWEPITADQLSIVCHNGHKFHKDELITWCLTQQQREICKCPICRVEMGDQFNQYINRIENDEEQEESSESSDSSIWSTSTESEENLNNVDHQEEIEQTIRLIEMLTEMNPQQREDWIQQNLRGNNLRHH